MPDTSAVVLNDVPVYFRVDPDLAYRGSCDLNYDRSLVVSLRDPDDPDAERITLHEYLHALIGWTDPQRVCLATDERHEDFVRMLTAGLYDVLGYRRATRFDASQPTTTGEVPDA